MKTILQCMLVLVMMLALVPASTDAQTSANPNNSSLYYYNQVLTAQPYYQTRIDTISSTGVKLGGADLVSLLLAYTDTMKADIYIDYAYRGSSTFTNVYSDSVLVEAAGKSEIKLRVPGTDRIGGIDRKLRARISQRSTSNFDSSATLTATWIWK